MLEQRLRPSAERPSFADSWWSAFRPRRRSSGAKNRSADQGRIPPITEELLLRAYDRCRTVKMSFSDALLHAPARACALWRRTSRSERAPSVQPESRRTAASCAVNRAPPRRVERQNCIQQLRSARGRLRSAAPGPRRHLGMEKSALDAIAELLGRNRRSPHRRRASSRRTCPCSQLRRRPARRASAAATFSDRSLPGAATPVEARSRSPTPCRVAWCTVTTRRGPKRAGCGAAPPPRSRSVANTGAVTAKRGRPQASPNACAGRGGARLVFPKVGTAWRRATVSIMTGGLGRQDRPPPGGAAISRSSHFEHACGLGRTLVAARRRCPRRHRRGPCWSMPPGGQRPGGHRNVPGCPARR